MSVSDASWEMRLATLLRSKGLLLAAVSLGALVIAGTISLVRAEDAAAGIAALLIFVGALVALIVAHGAVAADLRSGVALLWLQKPVSPVAFYMRRASNVVALSVLLSFALSGAAALLAALLATPQVGRNVLSATPMTALFAVSFSVLTFAISAWRTSLDAFFAFVLFYLTGVAALDEGLFGDVMGWVGLPLDAITTLGRLFIDGSTVDVGLSLLQLIRFLMIWNAVALLGSIVTTRSPLPRESTR